MRKYLIQLILISDQSPSLTDRVKYLFNWIIGLTPIVYLSKFLHLWFQDNWQFGLFVSAALIINMVVGAIRHIKTKTFTIKEFLLKNAEMAFVIITSYAMLEMMRYTAGANIAGEAFRVFIQITTLLYPTSKVFKNLYIITNKNFPPEFLMRKLYNFEQTGDMRSLFDTENKEVKK